MLVYSDGNWKHLDKNIQQPHFTKAHKLKKNVSLTTDWTSFPQDGLDTHKYTDSSHFIHYKQDDFLKCKSTNDFTRKRCHPAYLCHFTLIVHFTKQSIITDEIIRQRTWSSLFSQILCSFVLSDLPGRREAWAHCSHCPSCFEWMRSSAAMSAWRFLVSCGSD